MNATERVWYILLYSYIVFGLGYYLKKGFSVYQDREKPVPLIGIVERIPSSIDHLFDETGIKRLD